MKPIVGIGALIIAALLFVASYIAGVRSIPPVNQLTNDAAPFFYEPNVVQIKETTPPPSLSPSEVPITNETPAASPSVVVVPSVQPVTPTATPDECKPAQPRVRVPEPDQLRALGILCGWETIGDEYLTIEPTERRIRMGKDIAPVIIRALKGELAESDTPAFDGALLVATAWSTDALTDRDPVRGPLGRAIVDIKNPATIPFAVDFTEWAFRTGNFWRYFVYCCKLDASLIRPVLEPLATDPDLVKTNGNRAYALTAILYSATGDANRLALFSSVVERAEKDASFGVATELRIEGLSLLIRSGRKIGLEMALKINDYAPPQTSKQLIEQIAGVLNVDYTSYGGNDRDRQGGVLAELADRIGRLEFRNGIWRVSHTGNQKPPKTIDDRF